MPEPFVFEPAHRGATNVIAGLGGSSGSGKTKSALELATGMGGTIALVDTEEGRSRHYAGKYSFDIAQLGPPFTPERYMEAITAARAHVGPGGIIIVDSMTHEWAGTGGLLETADAFQRDAARKWGGSPDRYTFMSWSEPKQRHQRLVDLIVKLDCNIILCFRAKPKMKMMKVREGSRDVNKPVEQGIQPITDELFPYETTFFAILDAHEPGVPRWTHKSLLDDLRGVFIEGERINTSTGKRLAEWAKGEEMARIWVDNEGRKIGGPYDRISAALEEFEKLWNENKERVSHHRNYQTLVNFAPKVPGVELRKLVNEWATEMNGIMAKRTAHGPDRGRV